MSLRWSRVCIESVAHVLPDERVTTASIEARLDPVYRRLGIPQGQLEALTGIHERRFWPVAPRMGERAAEAGRRALEAVGFPGAELGALLYGGVCKDQLEPATACAAAELLGVRGRAIVADVGNACLGMMSAIVQVANQIELGQIRAGLVVSSESAREIVDTTVERMLREPTMETFKSTLATMTGGSAASAVLLVDRSISRAGHLLVGGASIAAPEHNGLCRWGPPAGLLGETHNRMDTDAAKVLQHGVPLGALTWDTFLPTVGWHPADVDKVICHQVGEANRTAILGTLGLDVAKDFSTYPWLGNTGSCAVPVTLSLAAQEGFLRRGDRTALLGIGSGLNCLMLGVQW